MPPNLRTRSTDRSGASPRRGADARSGGGNQRGGGLNKDLASAATAAAVPETPAEMAERLKAERAQELLDLQETAASALVAEEIGFALATEIGEKACDLYINQTFDGLATEYTALAVWDEMINSIKAFSAAQPAELPKFAAECEKPMSLPPPPGLAPPTPPPAPASALKSAGSAAAGSSSPGAADGKKPRRARVMVADPHDEEEKQHHHHHHQEKEEDRSHHLQPQQGEHHPPRAASPNVERARQDLQAAVEARLKSEGSLELEKQQEQQQQQKKSKRPDSPSSYAPEFKLDFAPPPIDNDPTWAPDSIPPPMICDLNARHAAGTKLKLVERPLSTGDIGESSMNFTRTRGTMIGGRRTMVGGRPLSGTMIGARPSSGQQTRTTGGSQSTGRITPTQLYLNEASKDTVPIHILTHHMSMMASASPYVRRNKTSSSFDAPMRDDEDGAPPGDANDATVRSPPGAQQRDGNSPGESDGGAPHEWAFGAPPGAGTVPPLGHLQTDQEERGSSAGFSSIEDDDSVQSPSEAEVAQKLQQRAAQRTRNATAFTTITNQLQEQAGGGGKPQPGSVVSASAAAAAASEAKGAEKNFVVDSRLGRVIAVSSVESGAKGKNKTNPITEAPRFAVAVPPPPPDPAEQQGGRHFRRSIVPSATTTGSSGSPSRSSPVVSSPRKKTRDHRKDPGNFFMPEVRVAPMIQAVNPSGGVIVKDDNGSRRNERPNQANKMSRSDYSKLLRVAPSVAAANASDFADLEQQQVGRGGGAQTARAAPAASQQQQQSVSAAGSPPKTARR